jgi:hypothetical protein
VRIAAVGLITHGRPADSFGLSERCLLGDRIFLMSPRLVRVQAEVPIRTRSESEIAAIKAGGRDAVR